MRDDGLDEAIRVAGGVGALARKIGISQPSGSNWARIPAERALLVGAATRGRRSRSLALPRVPTGSLLPGGRVLLVEGASGVSRTILRPDLYGNEPSSAEGVD